MKKLKIIALVAGLILAVNATAGAITFNQSYNGPITIKFKNFDTGVSYTLGGGISAVGIANVDLLGQAPATNAWDGVINPLIPVGPYAGQVEDAWLTVKVTSIETAGAVQLWADGDGGQEVVGMMYGLVDVAVGVGGMAVLSDGFNFDLYEQAAGTFDPTLGTGGRTGFSTYTGATGGTMLFSANTVPGVGINDLMFLDPATFGGVLPQFSHRGFSARADMFMDIIPGSGPWDQLITPVSRTDPFGGGAVSDLYTIASIIVNDGNTEPLVGDWDYLSHDPTRAYYVPEPMTMTLLFVGIGGLAGYVRKRRQA